MGVRERLHNAGQRLESFVGVKPMALALLGFFAYANAVQPPLVHIEGPEPVIPAEFMPAHPSTLITSPLVIDHPPPYVDMDTLSSPTITLPSDGHMPPAETTSYTAQEFEISPQVDILLDHLASEGLHLTKAPYQEIDGSTVFGASVDGTCSVDVGVTHLSESEINVYGGRVQVDDQGGVEDNRDDIEVHAEGRLEMGKAFSITTNTATEPVTYIKEELIVPLCDIYTDLQAQESASSQ